MSARQTIREIRDSVRSRARSATDVCRDALARLERVEPSLHAFNTVTRDEALARAAVLDRDFDQWREAPLLGVPVALKDNLCTRGVRTTASRPASWNTSFRRDDATVVSKLERAGAILVGKTNCDEFAMGSSTENPRVRAVTKSLGDRSNPWRIERWISAVAVAADIVPLALGSDTGGSIRQPAAMCGVVGIKPTYGRVSRYGLIAFGSSLDQIGPLTRTAYDAALSLAVYRRRGPGRCHQRARAGSRLHRRQLTGDISGAAAHRACSHCAHRGRPREPRGCSMPTSRARVPRRARHAHLDRGATASGIDVELPHARYATPVYYLVATAEASSNLRRLYDGVRYGFRAPDSNELQSMYARTREEGFGPEVKRRIMLGTYVLSAGYYDAYYLKAQQVRTLILRDYDRAFDQVDVVAMPTSPIPPFPIGERISDPLQMYLADIFTVSAPLAGLPAISVPCGFTPDRLPIGLQADRTAVR